MYRLLNLSHDSVGRRLSSNNPFRNATVQLRESNLAFEDWVEKNKLLIELDDDDAPIQRPGFPSLSRHGSDSNVNYRYVPLSRRV